MGTVQPVHGPHSDRGWGDTAPHGAALLARERAVDGGADGTRAPGERHGAIRAGLKLPHEHHSDAAGPPSADHEAVPAGVERADERHSNGARQAHGHAESFFPSE